MQNLTGNCPVSGHNFEHCCPSFIFSYAHSFPLLLSLTVSPTPSSPSSLLNHSLSLPLLPSLLSHSLLPYSSPSSTFPSLPSLTHSLSPSFPPLTCNIFIRTTSSLAGLVPTNLAWVTASERVSTPLAALGWVGSVGVWSHTGKNVSW